MNIRLILVASLVYPFANSARGQTTLEFPHTSFYFDGPAVASPIDWSNTYVFLLRRKENNLRIKAGSVFNGTVELLCSVKDSTAKDAPQDLQIRLGLNAPPDASVGTLRTDKDVFLESDFPRSMRYLAIVTKPRNKRWSDLGPVVPRLFVPLSPSFKVKKVVGKQAGLETIFRAISEASTKDSQMLVRWVYEEWKAEGAPYYRQMAPVVPLDPTLASVSGDSANLRVGETALAISRSSSPTARTYLTMIAGIWGNSARFEPFFLACQDRRTEALPDLLMEMIDDPTFCELKLDEAMPLARKVKRPYAGIIMQLTRVSDTLSSAQLADLFSLSGAVREIDRIKIYDKMVPSLPLELRKRYPDGLIPECKSDGSIPHEAELRQKWAAYLGLSEPTKP